MLALVAVTRISKANSSGTPSSPAAQSPANSPVANLHGKHLKLISQTLTHVLHLTTNFMLSGCHEKKSASRQPGDRRFTGLGLDA